MATIDTSIYGNIKPVQIEDPINQFARQQELSVNMLKAREMQQTAENRNMMRQLDPSDPEYINKISRFDPKLGAELGKSRLEADEKRIKMAGDSTKFYMDALPGVFNPQQMAELTVAQYNDPHLGPILKRVRSLEQALSTIPTDPQGFEMYKIKTGVGMKDFINSAVGQYEFSQKDPRFAEFQIKQKRAGATQVVLPNQERAEQTERGKFLVEDYKGVSNAAKVAAKTLPAIETNINLLDKGFDTGFSTEIQKGAANILGALGVKDAENFATNAQIFNAKANEAVLQRQLEQKGPQTESDAQRITQTGAQLGNTKAANRFILDVAKAQLKRDVEQRNFYDSWWKKNKTYDGAEDAWYSSAGGESLFKRPELAKYGVDTGPSVNAAPAATPAAPAANTVTLPNGTVKVFPSSEAAAQFKKAAGL